MHSSAEKLKAYIQVTDFASKLMKGESYNIPTQMTAMWFCVGDILFIFHKRPLSNKGIKNQIYVLIFFFQLSLIFLIQLSTGDKSSCIPEGEVMFLQAFSFYNYTAVS